MCQLHDKALTLSRLVHAGDLTDIEALELLFEFALLEVYIPSVYGDIEQTNQQMIRELGVVVGGMEITGSAVEHGLNAAMGVITGRGFDIHEVYREIQAGSDDDPLGQYYVGYQAFEVSVEETGFASQYFPDTGAWNQVRHFFAGLVGGTVYGGLGADAQVNQENMPDDRALYQASHRLTAVRHTWRGHEDPGDMILSYLANPSVLRRRGMLP